MKRILLVQESTDPEMVKLNYVSYVVFSYTSRYMSQGNIEVFAEGYITLEAANDNDVIEDLQNRFDAEYVYVIVPNQRPIDEGHLARK